MSTLEIFAVVATIAGLVTALGFKPPAVVRYGVVPLIISIASTHLVFEYVVRPIAIEHDWPDSSYAFVWITTAAICFGISQWIVALSIQEEEEKERKDYNEKHPDAPLYPLNETPSPIFFVLLSAFGLVCWWFVFYLIDVLFH